MKKGAHGTLWLCHVVPPFIRIPISTIKQRESDRQTVLIYTLFVNTTKDKEPQILLRII